VARVLARAFAIPGDPKTQAWKIARDLLPPGAGGQFNEALMELGATVCTPRAPDCPHCPIRPVCRGKDEPAKFPAARKRSVRPLLEWSALALRRRDGAVLLARRPAEALFGGLWDLPAERPEGIRILGRVSSLGSVEQTLTNRQVRVILQTARASGTPKRP